MEAGKYLILSLCLGGLSVWGSENFLWMMPPDDMAPLDFIMTVIAKSVSPLVRFT